MIASVLYSKPGNIMEAMDMAARYKTKCKFIAGGTDIMVNKYQGNETANHLIDITGIEALRGIRFTGNGIHIGSLTTLDEITKSNVLHSQFPALIEAALSVGSPLIRKVGTIGGNILCENRCIFYNQSEWWREAIGYCLKCNGDVCIATGGTKACYSEFVSDTAPALIAMHASVRLLDAEGEHVLPLEALYTGDGVKPKAISNATLVQEIILPISPGISVAFRKLRLRESLEFTSLTTAVSVNEKNEIRIVLAGVDPKPVVVEGLQSQSKSDLINKAIKGARAVDNDMFSRVYRKEMIRVFINQCFEQLSI